MRLDRLFGISWGALSLATLVACSSSSPDSTVGAAGGAPLGRGGSAGAVSGTGGMMDLAGPDASALRPDAMAVDAAKVDAAAADTARPVSFDVAPTGGPAQPSEGCGKAAPMARAQWVSRTVTVAGVERTFWIWLPKTYDPSRPYRSVMLLHGCGDAGRENNNVQMQTASREDAVLIRGVAIGRCWEYGIEGPDVLFFDEMVKALNADFCVDRSRLFAVGYSSGSWLINLLNCTRVGVLRAGGTVAGGQPRIPSMCKGRFAQIFVHDDMDPENNINGSVRVRDRLMTTNGCKPMPPPEPEGPPPCVRYQTCAEGFPIDWCQTSGKGHSRQDGLAAPAFWRFFQGL